MKALKSLAVASSVAIATGVLVAGFVAPAYSADAPSAPPGRIPTVTRLVKLFLDREEMLSAAMRAGDMASLERTLTDDFELRAGARAATPIARADCPRPDPDCPPSTPIARREELKRFPLNSTNSQIAVCRVLEASRWKRVDFAANRPGFLRRLPVIVDMKDHGGASECNK